jgi:hypothetical protein
MLRMYTFNLEYGSTVGVHTRIIKPDISHLKHNFLRFYAADKRVDTLRSLAKQKTDVEVYAILQFSEDDIRNVKAGFFSRTYSIARLVKYSCGASIIPQQAPQTLPAF